MVGFELGHGLSSSSARARLARSSAGFAGACGNASAFAKATADKSGSPEGGGARRTRRVSLKVSPYAEASGDARRTRPVFSRFSRIGEPGVFGSAAWLSHPAPLAPYDHEPVQRVGTFRNIPDLAVSCPAS